jgi:hypothetical protein
MKDAATAVGILLTFALGVWNIYQNYRNTRRTSFINTVTSERVKWIAHVRETISRFCGLTYHWAVSPQLQVTAGGEDVLREIDTLRHLIPLQLNPDGALEKDIVSLVAQIPHATDPKKTDLLWDLLDKLIGKTQLMLKAEWEKVKDEAENGRLTATDSMLRK